MTIVRCGSTWRRTHCGCPLTRLPSLFHPHRAEGLSTRAPAQAWYRPPWPSARSMLLARTACWPATPTAPGARTPRPAWPCTRRTAPAGTQGTRRAGPPSPPVGKYVRTHDRPSLSCRDLTQQMSGDTSGCRGKWLLLAVLLPGQPGLVIVSWCSAGVASRTFCFSFSEQRASIREDTEADPAIPLICRKGCLKPRSVCLLEGTRHPAHYIHSRDAALLRWPWGRL